MKIMKSFLFIFASAAILLFQSCASVDSSLVPPDNYELKTSMEFVAKSLTYEKLTLPDYFVEGYKSSCVGLIDKSRLLMLLYSESGGNISIKELGLYNTYTKEYLSELVIDKNELFEICAINTKYLVLRISKDDWNTCGIFVYSFHNKKLQQIFSYSVDPITKAVFYNNVNNILLLGDTVWFDDYYKDQNSEIVVDCYEYRITTEKLQKVKDEAQNPLFYKDKVFLFRKNNNNEYKQLCAFDGSEKIDVKDQLIDITSSRKGIYCIENNFTDDKNHITEFQIKDMANNLPILTTTRSIGQLKASDYFVTWLNFFEDIPCIYDVRLKKVVAFTELQKGINTFYLKDDYGLLINSYNDINEVYYFEAIH